MVKNALHGREVHFLYLFSNSSLRRRVALARRGRLFTALRFSALTVMMMVVLAALAVVMMVMVVVMVMVMGTSPHTGEQRHGALQTLGDAVGELVKAHPEGVFRRGVGDVFARDI